MFKKPTKKQFLIRRIILSSIATLAVLIIATSAILFMLGYQLDSDNGRLEQGALLQFDSTPSGADVSVDGRSVGSRTATKQTVVAGTHTVKMSKYQYQDWTRTVTLDAGTLTWLDYTRFVPTARPVEKVASYPSLVGISFSPDYKWAVAQETASAPKFQLIDLRAETVKTSTLELPVSSYADATTAGVTHSFMVTSWDSGSRYIIVKHVYSDQTEWLVVDTQNSAQTTSVTQRLGVGLKDMQFASTDGKILYGLTNDGTLRRIDLSAATLSRAFVTHADSFSMYDNTVLSYVGVNPNDATQRVAGVYRDGDESSHVLRTTTTPDAVLKIATSRYFSDDYVAIAEGNVVTILKGSYPTSSAQDNSTLKQFATLQLSGAVSALSFSPKGNYVIAQSGDRFKSYEIEHMNTAAGAIATTAGAPATTLKWLDIAHLWNDDSGSLVMRDFDGSNVYDIMKVEPGFSASLSQNGRFFYAIGKNADGTYQLQRVKMILD
jgi:hypothetical protein